MRREETSSRFHEFLPLYFHVFLRSLARPHFGPCCDAVDAGHLVEGGYKNAAVCECRGRAEERSDSVHGVRSIPLISGLENLPRRLFLIASRAWTALKCSVRKRAGARYLLSIGDALGSPPRSLNPRSPCSRRRESLELGGRPCS